MTAQAGTYRPQAEVRYESNHAYLQDELRKLDALLRLRVAALRRARSAGPEAGGRPLYISDEEVDALLSEGRLHRNGFAGHDEDRRPVRALQQAINWRVKEALARGVFLGLPRLVQHFGLSPFDEQVVLICLAPELRRTYDTLYAYLQDDVTRKRPSVDLVLDLLCETEAEKWDARARLQPQAPLRHACILEGIEDPHSPSGSSGLAQFLRLDPRILQFILGHQVLDARLDGLVRIRRGAAAPDELAVDASVKTALLGFARRYATGGELRRTVVHLQGPYGVGRRDLAGVVGSVLGTSMLCLDAAHLSAREGEAEILLQRAFRESLLLQMPLYCEGADAFLRDDERARVRPCGDRWL